MTGKQHSPGKRRTASKRPHNIDRQRSEPEPAACGLDQSMNSRFERSMRISRRRLLATSAALGALPLAVCASRAAVRRNPDARLILDDASWREPLRPRALLVLAVLHEILDHGGIGQRRGVAEATRFVFGDLAQDAAHDLAGAGFRQSRCELDLV